MWHIHPQYNLTSKHNDLALLQVQHNENFPFVGANLYPMVPVKLHRLVFSVGYGYLAPGVISHQRYSLSTVKLLIIHLMFAGRNVLNLVLSWTIVFIAFKC